MEDDSQDGVMELLGWLMLTAIAVMFVILATQKAVAHDWYPLRCCSGRDCAPIKASSVTRIGDQYVITLRRGEHPMLDPAAEVTIRQWPIERTEGSQDGEYHICLTPIGASVLCLFVPLNG